MNGWAWLSSRHQVADALRCRRWEMSIVAKIKASPFEFLIVMSFFLGFLGCGLTLVLSGMTEAWRAWDSQRWLTTSGTILASAIDFYSNSGGEDVFSAEISYEYAPDQPGYEGQILTASRINFGDISYGDSAVARAIVNRYPVGQTVTVYLNPRNPAEAVLEPGLTGSLVFFPFLGCVFCLIGGACGYRIFNVIQAD